MPLPLFHFNKKLFSILNSQYCTVYSTVHFINSIDFFFAQNKDFTYM